MTRESIRLTLLQAGTPPDLATIYAHAFAEYREAMANIQKNGAVVANPRTGAPIDNPYLKVRDRAEEKLAKLGRRVKGASELWSAIADFQNPTATPTSDPRSKPASGRRRHPRPSK